MGYADSPINGVDGGARGNSSVINPTMPTANDLVENPWVQVPIQVVVTGKKLLKDITDRLGGDDAARAAATMSFKENGAEYLGLLLSIRGGKAGALSSKPTAPRNSHLAGSTHPKTGIPFDKNGHPDFSGVVKAEVTITQTGTRAGDFRAANEAAGLRSTPEGYTWHHHQDGRTMQLVPREIHAQTGHTGGFNPGP